MTRNASIESLLLVEDDPGFARLLREKFKEQGSPETEVTHVALAPDGGAVELIAAAEANLVVAQRMGPGTVG